MNDGVNAGQPILIVICSEVMELPPKAVAVIVKVRSPKTDESTFIVLQLSEALGGLGQD